MSYLFLILTTYLAVVTAHSPKAVPTGWENMCTVTEDTNILGLYVDNVTTTSDHVLRMDCHVTGNSGTDWKLQTLRNWFFKPHEFALFVRVQCSDGGKISLPWPMKAHGMVGLVVSNCKLTDKYADFNNPVISTIPEQLRVLEIRDSVWLRDAAAFDTITDPNNLASLSSEYDCGQDSTIEYEVFSNVTDELTALEEGLGKDLEFQDHLNLLSDTNDVSTGSSQTGIMKENLGINNPKPTENSLSDLNIDISFPDSNSTTENATIAAQKEYLDLLNSLQSLDIQCNYKNLRVMEQSSPGLMPVHTFSIMVQSATYPELRIMNFSRSGITDFPRELKDFRTHFPKLEYLDFSKNYLREIDVPARHGHVGSYLTLDVRYNQITNLSLDKVTSWATLDDVFIDIRNNPLHCDCRMEQLINKIQSDNFLRGILLRYDYLKDVKCFSPESVKGQTLGTVTLQCGENFSALPKKSDNGISSSTVGVIVGCSLLGLIVVITVAVAALKFRQRRLKNENLEDESTLEKQKSFHQKDIETALSNFENHNFKA